MDEERPSNTGRSRMTRRGLLAVAGTTALAGCNGLTELGDETDPTIRAYDLRDINPQEDSDPVVSESVPVDIAPDHFDTIRNRVTALLEELPTPLGSEDIPNGYVREQVLDAASNATDGLSDARDAPTEMVALTSLQRARAEARYAAAGWAVVEQDRSAEPLQQEYRQIVSEARSVRDAHKYVGRNPVRAALVHARIEDMLDRVIDSSEPRKGENRLLYVAEWGDTVESAQAHLDDARHLDDRLTTTLPADAGTVKETLTEAAETLFADVQSRESEVPPEPTAEDWGIPERVIDELRQRATYGVTRLADANGPASAVVHANRQLTRFRALDRLQERIDDGELARPQSAEAVREIRSTAYDALEAALEESPAPDLTRTAVTRTAQRLTRSDRDLARYEGEFPISRLDSTIVDYIVATAIGRVASDISERTVETLEST